MSHLEDDLGQPRLRAFFEALGESHRVVRYDRLGVGLSDRERVDYSMEGEVAVLEQLLDELGEKECSLLAISCAAPVAVEVASRRPEQVQKLVLFGAYANGTEIAPPGVRELMLEIVRKHWGLGSRVLSDVFVPGLSGAELKDAGRRQRASADADTVGRLLELSYSMDCRASLASAQCPALVVHRREDKAVPFEAGRDLAAGLPEASFVTLDGAAHLPWEGAPDVVPIVRAFLKGEMGVERLPYVHLRDMRAVRVDGEEVPLSDLEDGLLACLEDAAGSVVTREHALQRVWQQPHAGSNVVDAVIRSLRKKLGRHADAIETVVGRGYRLRSRRTPNDILRG